ncbi:hypothetical protein M1N20_02305 [Dehalococcoidia bacterium]|nr:hypothetical protein [Dehalococcoidia bacterium]
MGTKIGAETTVKEFGIRFLRNQGGPVAQILHPLSLKRDDVFLMSDRIKKVESRISKEAPDVKVVVTGGGFVEIHADGLVARREWRSQKCLERLLAFVEERLTPFTEALGGARRDYVIGIDVLIDDWRIGQFPIGQFAVVFVTGKIESVVWKSYPVKKEADFLAGFGTCKGRRSPRFVTTSLGKSLILVCHDAQVYNHRSHVLVHSAHGPTPRMRVMDEMREQMEEERPLWAFNPVHWIEKAENMKTFFTSYKQIATDHNWKPSVVGAFGYGPCVYHQLESLAQKAQYPPNTARCAIVIE